MLPKWERSSRCGDYACVEVAQDVTGEILVRDSKEGPEGSVLRFTPEEWAAFVGAVRSGEFEFNARAEPDVLQASSGEFEFRAP